MKAIVRAKFGTPDVLQFAEVAKPTPRENEVLLKLFAASVNPVDLFHMQGWPWFIRIIPGLGKPKFQVLGCDIAGRVEAVGTHVTQLHPGDDVFGVTGLAGGAFAEYVCVPEDRLTLKPANRSFEDAASLPVAALTALQGLRDHGRIQPGQKVLIDGASGGVGTFAIQIAKSFDAEVTAVCSTAKIDTARSLGADHVIDYTREDFAKHPQRYDLIFSANAHHSIFACLRALNRNGIYVLAGGATPQILQSLLLAPLLSRLGSKKACFFIAKINQQDLLVLKDLFESGKLSPVIDRRYPLSAAADALRYLAQKHARGKIILTIDPS